MIVFAALAVVCLAYMAVCDYAGLSGKIEYYQKEFLHVSRSFGFVEYPYWFIHATVSGTLAVIFLYALYRMKSSKKRYISFIICLFIPYLVNAQFQPNSEGLRFITLFIALFVAAMFALANIPGVVDRAITKQLIFRASDLEYDNEERFKKRLNQLEWLRFYPLKKALIGLLWLACFALGIMGVAAYFKELETDFLLIALLFLAVAAFTAGKAWRYIKTPYHCVPVLNKVLSKTEIQSLLQGEKFEAVSFENEDLQKYTPILISENWAVIEGLLVSRKLVLRMGVDSGVPPERRLYRIEVTYLNGEHFKTRPTDIPLVNQLADEMQAVLYDVAGIHFPVRPYEEIMQKYKEILPEMKNPHDKLWHLLTNDIREIKEDYKAVFAPDKEQRKKKRK